MLLNMLKKIRPMSTRLHAWKNNLSLSTIITLGALLLFALATLAEVYFISTTERNHALAELQTRLDTRSSFKAVELQQTIENLRSDVLFLSSTPPVQGIIRATFNHGIDPLEHNELAVWKNRFSKILAAFINANPDYYQVRYIGVADGGRELVRADYLEGFAQATAQNSLQKKGSRDYFLATLKLKPGQIYLSEINLNREHGQVEKPHRRTLRAVTPIYTPDGKLFGMVAINMNVGPMLDKLAEGMRESISAYLLNQQGDYLAHPDAEHTFGFDLGRRSRWQDDITGTQTVESKTPGTSVPLQTSFLSGEPIYVIARELHFDPQQPRRFVTLIYAVSDTVISQQIAHTRKLAIASALGVAAIISLLLFLYVRRAFVPLQQLTKAAYEAGEGRYNTSLSAIRGGELGALATAFRTMLQRIGVRDSEIRQVNDELARSEAFSNLIIDSVPDVILIVDVDGMITRVNSRVEPMFGYTADELLGQPVEILVPDRFRAHHPPLRQSYMDEPSMRMLGKGQEVFGQHRNGHDIPVDVWLVPMKTSEALHIIVSITDISARKAADQALRSSEEQLRLMTDNVKGYALIMLNPEGQVYSWNEGSQRLNGYGYKDIIGRPMANFFTAEDVAAGRPAALLRQAEIEGRADDEGWRVRKDGTRFYVDMVLTAIRDPVGDLLGFANITRDITERKVAEEEILRLNSSLENEVAERTAELQAANRELESFAYAIAHDLRAPLRAMIGFSQALMEDYGEGFEPEAKTYLDQIVIGSTRMSELVDGLLTLSRSTQGELQRDEVDLSALAERLLTEMAGIEPERQLSWEVAPGLVTRGDGRMLEAVLRNLLGNAWKYTEGTAEAKIRVYAEQDNQQPVFCIADNGAGFDMAHAGKLFQPFQRLHRQDEFVGIGIGLATVQRIVHRHGGQSQDQATPGRGAMFCFSLGP